MLQSSKKNSSDPGHDESSGLVVEAGRIRAFGSWTLANYRTLDTQIQAMPPPSAEPADLDLKAVTAMDSAGAWLLHGALNHWQRSGAQIRVVGASERTRTILGRVSETSEDIEEEAVEKKHTWLERIGIATQGLGTEAVAFLAFIGEIAESVLPLLLSPFRIRWRRVLHNLQDAGVAALPIVGLLSFLMGMVIAYQGSVPLRKYGANIYVVDLVGLAMLREISPIITAIIVAGRTGAAYTAQIGAMKVGEEIDALSVMGVPPIEVLVIPKLMALIVALPLLTVFSDAVGLLGGMLMAHSTLDVGPHAFIDELLTAVDVQSYLIGVGKAPVFAAIIAAVGCFQGFRTKASAESVGRQTTISVVQSIFLVIVVDAAFSVAFSALGI